MAERKPTPEEQLLKLIEKSDDAPAAQPKPAPKKKAPEKKAPAEPRKPFNPFAAITGLFPAKPKTQQPALAQTADTQVATETSPLRRLTELNLKLINNILIAFVVSAGLYLALDLYLLKEDETAFLAPVGLTEPVYPVLSEEMTPGNEVDIEYYKQPLNRRNPFIPASADIPVADSDKVLTSFPSAPKADALNVLNSFKLVGISRGGDEPLAMIEDTETGKTHFLKKGQTVRGVRVQNVEKDKVTISFEGEEGVLV